jgi:hypothetical protein
MAAVFAHVPSSVLVGQCTKKHREAGGGIQNLGRRNAMQPLIVSKTLDRPECRQSAIGGLRSIDST